MPIGVTSIGALSHPGGFHTRCLEKERDFRFGSVLLFVEFLVCVEPPHSCYFFHVLN